jgi:hypothetical protein
MREVVGSGLTLSKGKTLVSSRYFSLNSRLFKALSVPRLVPSIRSSAFGFRKLEDGVAGFQGRWRRVLKDYPCGAARRAILEEEFLRWNVPYIVASRRSVTRGLDCKFGVESLSRLNLWKREVFYLSLEREVPLPASPAVIDQQRIPDGWELRRIENYNKEIKEIQKRIGPEFIACAWSPASLTGEERMQLYREAVKQAPYYVPASTSTLKKRGKLLGLSPANARRFLKPAVLRAHLSDDGCVRFVEKNPYRILDYFRPRGKKVWMPAGLRRLTSEVEETECDSGRSSLRVSVKVVELPDGSIQCSKGSSFDPVDVKVLPNGSVMFRPPSTY